MKVLCTNSGYGLDMEEIDIHNGGSSHDLLDKATQERIMSQIESGDYDLIILSPPCGSWSRANWANKSGPQPIRDRWHPWGFKSFEYASDRQRL